MLDDWNSRRLGGLAEGTGFEPAVACTTAVFKTATIVHSVTPPGPNNQLPIIQGNYSEWLQFYSVSSVPDFCSVSEIVCALNIYSTSPIFYTCSFAGINLSMPISKGYSC